MDKAVQRAVADRKGFDPFGDLLEVAEVERLNRVGSGCHSLKSGVELLSAAAGQNDAGA